MDHFFCGFFFMLMGMIEMPSHAEDQAWMLEVNFDRPQQVALDIAMEGEEGYWYMTYEVTNRTGADRYLFLKIIVVVNDDLNRKHRDRLIPALEKGIERTLDTELLNRVELIGKIKDGETKRCIALLGTLGYDIKTIDLYIDGLANETLARNEQGKFVIRTRRVHALFRRLGDPEIDPFPVLTKQRVEKAYMEEPITEPEGQQ